MDDREAKIRRILAIKPLNHGEVYTCQIVIPDRVDLTEERRKILEESLKQHNSNLLPLILRRTDKYGQDKDYEIVYGEDIAFVAQKLDIERLWAWVFDLDDQQAAAVKQEFLQLLSLPPTARKDTGILSRKTNLEEGGKKANEEEREVKNYPPSFSEDLEHFKRAIVTEVTQQIAASNKNIVSSLSQIFMSELKGLNQEISEIRRQLASLQQHLGELSTFTQKLSDIRGEIRIQLVGTQIPQQPATVLPTQPEKQEGFIGEIFTRESLEKKRVAELKNLAKQLKIKECSRMKRKEEFIQAILDYQKRE